MHFFLFFSSGHHQLPELPAGEDVPRQNPQNPRDHMLKQPDSEPNHPNNEPPSRMPASPPFPGDMPRSPFRVS